MDRVQLIDLVNAFNQAHGGREPSAIRISLPDEIDLAEEWYEDIRLDHPDEAAKYDADGHYFRQKHPMFIGVPVEYDAPNTEVV